MKCEHCGSNLNIEDKFCPYCGKPNPYAKLHQKEMERFARDYKETKEDVLEQSSRFNKRTVRITILAVLIALIAVFGILTAMADDIRYWQEERNIAANAPKYVGEIEKYMEDRDYTGLYYFFTEKHISYSTPLQEYDAVFSGTQRYRMFYENLILLKDKEAFPETHSYYVDSEIIEDIARDIHGVYEELKPTDYHPENWEGNKMEYLEDMRDSMEIITAGFFGITLEEAQSMRTMTMSRINVMLEDSYEKKN